MKAYTFGEFTIPDYMMEGLRQWIEHGIEPGSFLMAVIHNDLRESVGRADEHNMRNLPAYVAYLYNEAPAPCWGSRAKADEWMDLKAAEAAERSFLADRERQQEAAIEAAEAKAEARREG